MEERYTSFADSMKNAGDATFYNALTEAFSEQYNLSVSADAVMSAMHHLAMDKKAFVELYNKPQPSDFKNFRSVKSGVF